MREVDRKPIRMKELVLFVEPERQNLWTTRPSFEKVASLDQVEIGNCTSRRPLALT